MVDFTKRLSAKTVTRPVDPEELYNSLDRASDKGPLRPAQSAVLKEWHTNQRNQRDVIVKLHTGQGKTLIGLLILQSKINEKAGPSVYLCPNNYLIEQTCIQASQFGIRFCRSEDGELPQDFLDGRSVYVTSIQKMFNGFTKFGLGQRSLKISSLLMDDSHACIDAIRNAFTIRLQQKDETYQRIFQLFAQSLESQGAGTFTDLKNANPNAFLPIPYWEWKSKKSDITEILGKVSGSDTVKFIWPLLKDSLEHCQCMIGGENLEIQPYMPDLELFGSYFHAKHRFFMSATVTNDSFLVRGLRLSPKTIREPIVYKDEKWSGEKMILIPSLLHEDLQRSEIIAELGRPSNKKFGTVALTTSFKSAETWKNVDAVVATKETIIKEISHLREGKYNHTLVIVNRYDGIDLPDATCRILIFDGQPFSDSLIDRYAEECRSNSEIIAVRTARVIEQGLGRSVRGEKDYSVIIILGARLIKTIRNAATRKFFSNQTRQQVELGLGIATMAGEDEAAKNSRPMEVLVGLINQCLKRDEGWKAFYVQNMESVPHNPVLGSILDIFQLELEAEEIFQRGDPRKAVQVIQKLIDDYITDEADKGWYMQEMARYADAFDKNESNKLQVEAHSKNRFLLKPRNGMHIDRLIVVSQARVFRIITWVRVSENHEQLMLAVEEILSRLEFGTSAERFEAAFNDLGKALGFNCERPDKAWKEGPDNLWGVIDSNYLLVECKNEVLMSRTSINKSETGQMNNSCAWFAANYAGAKSTNIMIIPTNELGPGAGFNEEVGIMSNGELKKLRKNVLAFFNEFTGKQFDSLSEQHIQQWLNEHELSVDAILGNYKRPVRS